MTYERREEIFSKDAITSSEVAELLSVSLTTANTIIRNIRLATGDKLGIQGRVLVTDYLEYFKMPYKDRYGRRVTDDDNNFEVNLKPEDKQRRVFSVMCPDGLAPKRLQ